MTQFIKFFSFFILIILISCSKKTTQIVVEEQPKPDKLERKKDKELMARIDSLYKLRPQTFFSKISTDYRDTNQSVSFRTNIKMVCDSATYALIKKGPIPLVSALIRKDSILISNKFQNCFIKKDLAYFRDNFGYQFSLSNVEELLLGLPLGFDTTQRYYRYNDKHNYVVATDKKREIRRELKGKDPLINFNGKDTTDEDNISIRYFLNENLDAIKQIIIDSPDDSTHITIDYPLRELINGFFIPKEVSMKIQFARNTLYVSMVYESSEINKPQDIYFIIPEDDEECGKK